MLDRELDRPEQIEFRIADLTRQLASALEGDYKKSLEKRVKVLKSRLPRKPGEPVAEAAPKAAKSTDWREQPVPLEDSSSQEWGDKRPVNHPAASDVRYVPPPAPAARPMTAADRAEKARKDMEWHKVKLELEGFKAQLMGAKA
jgi:hypothetical protein